MQPGYGIPMPEPTLVQIGDILVSRNWVTTPRGSAPLAGSQWYLNEQSYPVRRTPGWAIAVAIVTAVFFLIGLLFLLVKETRWEAYAEVTVRSGGLAHTTQVPRSTPAGAQVLGQVTYVQQLAGQAAWLG